MNLKLPTMAEATAFYISAIVGAAEKGHQTIVEQHLAKTDLFFLLVYVLGRKDAAREWIYQRCREVESNPDGYIDIWSREHYKSTIITLALTIQDILNDQEITVGIFSFNRPTAKAFLRQIKREFESNEKLKSLFPEILWQNPGSEAPTWSEDNGLVVKRQGNPKEATIEAYGLIDGQPTALCIETPVLTTRGWKKHGDLAFGDRVFGEDGKPVTVIYNTGPMLGQLCSHVKFSDTDIIAANDHFWPVDRMISTRNKITGKQDSGWSITEREVVRTVDLPLSSGEFRDKHRRLLATPIVDSGIRDKLPLAPYILGLWLGDGSSDCGIITTGDYELLDEFTRHEFTYEVAQDRGNYKMFRLIGLRPILKKMGLLWNKHVPEEYFRAAPADRLSLLQGLMDSDGACHSAGWGQCVFSNTNTKLVEATHFLASSLGFRPTRIKENPVDDDPRHAMRYVFSFVGVKSEPPFRLKRKLARCVEQRRNPARYVREISPVESRPVNCIQVAAENGIYLVGTSLVPTHNSKHYKLMVYDDVVTINSVSTPDMIRKVTESWELSRNLTSEGGRTRYIGTRYSHNDTHRIIIERRAAIERRHPCTINGEEDGEPVLWTREQVAEKRREMGPYTFGAQNLCNPTSDRTHGFRDEWLRYYDAHGDHNHMNKYICVDAASSKKRESDYTAMAVIGLSGDQNFYLLDAVRDRMSLTERGNAVFELHKRWKPKGVAYEKYGQMSDIEYLKERMQRENYRFEIEEVGGQMSKHDRIRRMVPIFETGRFYLPETLIKIDYEGRHVDITRAFVDEEFRPFPVGLHEDLFDAISRIWDIGHVWPKEYSRNVDRYARPRLRRVGNVTYMAA